MDNIFGFLVGHPWLAARHSRSCFLKGTGIEYRMQKLVGQAKDCEITYPLLPQENLDLGKINLIVAN